MENETNNVSRRRLESGRGRRRRQRSGGRVGRGAGALRVSRTGRRRLTARAWGIAQNRRNTSARIELMKYNPFLRKHTLHRELKK